MVIYYPASGDPPVGDQARLHLSVASGLPDVVQQIDALVEAFLRPMLGCLPDGLQLQLSDHRAMLVGAEPQLLLPSLVHPGALPRLLGASSYLVVQEVALWARLLWRALLRTRFWEVF